MVYELININQSSLQSNATYVAVHRFMNTNEKKINLQASSACVDKKLH